jgi:hypothetical protein
MPSSPSETSYPDSLQKQLDEAENELRLRLEEACEAEARGVSTESTEEVRRLEDNLLAAASAAKQTIAVRGHIKRRKYAGPAKIAMGVREFTDDELRPWRAWLVVPGLSKASSTGPQFLGDFQNGWICFEGLDSSARRRLPYSQAGWPTISDEELKHLVRHAIDAPVRENRTRGQALTDR